MQQLSVFVLTCSHFISGYHVNLFFLLRKYEMSQWSEEKKKKVSEAERKKRHRMRERERKKIRTANPSRSSSECAGKLPGGLEAECVTALWQLFVSGRFRANWCKRHSQGLLHESTCSWGVGSTPQTLLGLHFNLFYVGMQTLPQSENAVVCVCVCTAVKAQNS